MQNNRPIIGITIGDPAGIGPEIVCKALASKELYELCQPVVFGPQIALETALCFCKEKLSLHPIQSVTDRVCNHGIIDIIDLPKSTLQTIRYSQPLAEYGVSTLATIRTAIDYALKKEIDALVTAPINKQALQLANSPWIDHSQMLASLTKSSDTQTMFITHQLRILFYSKHVALRKVPDLIQRNELLQFIRKSNDYLTQLGILTGSFAIAGLNPHNSDHCLFGNEEEEIIIPAIKQAQQEGYPIEGPIPSDSVFHLAKIGKYCAVISLYHDQGHIAAKTYDFEHTVSLTLGLPFLRTSVDHGTAYDIAGKGVASEISMIEAIKVATQYYNTVKDNKR